MAKLMGLSMVLLALTPSCVAQRRASPSASVCNMTKLSPRLAKFLEEELESCAFEKIMEGYYQRTLTRLGVKAEDVSPTIKGKIEDSLAETPPGGKRALVKEAPVFEVKVESVMLEELFTTNGQELVIGGYMNASWEDQRLEFSDASAEFVRKQADGMRLHGDHASFVWLPDFESEHPYAGYRGKERVREVFLYKNGTVRAEFYFAASQECISFADLPNAFSTCCYAFTSTMFPDQVRVVGGDKEPKMRISPKFESRARAVGSFFRTMERSNEVELCLEIAASSAVAYSVMIPLACAAFVVIAVPLCASWKVSVVAKFLGLFFFITILVYSEAEMLRFAGGSAEVPKVFKLFGFFMWVTAVSLALTLALWGWQKRAAGSRVNPHRLLVTASNALNGLMCTETGNEKGGESTEIETERREVCAGLNNVLTLLFTAVYVIGAIVIMS